MKIKDFILKLAQQDPNADVFVYDMGVCFKLNDVEGSFLPMSRLPEEPWRPAIPWKKIE